MDETAMAHNFSGEKGTAVCRHRLPPGHEYGAEPLSTSDLRGHVTHIAMFTHDTSTQPLLPQILLGNASRFTLSLLAPLTDQLPPNIYLWREAPSWTNKVVMQRVLKILRDALAPILATHHIILVLGVAKQQIDRGISLAATRNGTQLVYVPAQTIWLLQVCDTHVFRNTRLRCAKALA